MASAGVSKPPPVIRPLQLMRLLLKEDLLTGRKWMFPLIFGVLFGEKKFQSENL
jgi:hypothetical protein